jgi:hypothetical protein
MICKTAIFNRRFVLLFESLFKKPKKTLNFCEKYLFFLKRL